MNQRRMSDGIYRKKLCISVASLQNRLVRLRSGIVNVNVVMYCSPWTTNQTAALTSKQVELVHISVNIVEQITVSVIFNSECTRNRLSVWLRPDPL